MNEKWYVPIFVIFICILLFLGFRILRKTEKEIHKQQLEQVYQGMIGKRVLILGDTLTIKYYQDEQVFILDNGLIIHKNYIKILK